MYHAVSKSSSRSADYQNHAVRSAFLGTQSASTVEGVQSKSAKTLENTQTFPYLSKTQQLSSARLDMHIWDSAFAAGISSEFHHVCKTYNDQDLHTKGERAVAAYIGNAVNAYAWLCRKPEASFKYPALLEFLPKFARVTRVVILKNPTETYDRILKHSEDLSERNEYDWIEWIRSLPH